MIVLAKRLAMTSGFMRPCVRLEEHTVIVANSHGNEVAATITLTRMAQWGMTSSTLPARAAVAPTTPRA